MAVAVIGGGFSGTMAALHLLRATGGKQKIYLIERTGRHASGAAYGTSDPGHLLNVRADKMGAWGGKADHFLAWLASHHSWHKKFPDFIPMREAFAPRALYGLYLADQLEQARKGPGGKALELIKGEVSDVTETKTGLKIKLPKRTISCTTAVLALGNLPPAPAAVPGAESLGCTYHDDVWSPGSLDEIETDLDVLIVGAGLSMADVLVTLLSRKHKGAISVLSRRGLLPQPHGAGQTFEIDLGSAAARGLVGLSKRVVAEAFRAERAGAGWRAAVDALRPISSELWNGLDSRERAAFLRHLRPFWDVHRHRLPQEVHALIVRAIANGKVRWLKGRIVSTKRSKDGLSIEIVERGSGQTRQLSADSVINCTGPAADLSGSPLMLQLLKRGLCVRDKLGLGVRTAANGAVFKEDGTASARLFALGPMRRADLWETVAVPEIRSQAAALAQYLVL